MPEGNPLAIFAPGLNALGVPWMVVGSIASSAYGERRSTLDLDVVAVVKKHDAVRFLSAFPEADFYCPPAETIREESARAERGHFNLIHQHTVYKADIYIATGGAFDRWAFENRRALTAGETPVWLAPPEYVIVHKLQFFREGGSEKHLRDIRGMLAVTEIDAALLKKEIAARGLEEAWRAVDKGN
ncbi:MAG: hypothetical protein DLM73_03475 [Chthoniobacterales bacterium]|nr:MAG: hypothetical protein DLM73_03475 [Chthoniobacterales bacterium]